MKNLLCKMIPMIGVVFFTASIVSCSSDNAINKENDLPINTVTVFINRYYSISRSKDLKNAEILEQLKKLKYIAGYTEAPVGYSISLVDFRKENVKSADKEKVLADLTAKAHAHYKAAVKDVNDFDFNSLVKDEFAEGRITVSLSIGEENYDIDAVIQKPLIWDKAWSTAVADCPIKEMSFKGTKNVVATLTLADGAIIQSTDISRLSDAIIIKTPSRHYTFQIISATQIKLSLYRDVPGGIKIDVKDKNYLFDTKK